MNTLPASIVFKALPKRELNQYNARSLNAGCRKSVR